MAADPDADATRTLDAREIDGEPFSDIMDALDDLDPNGTLILLNSFEPVPLYDVLDDRGFTHEAERDGDTWRVRIEHA